MKITEHNVTTGEIIDRDMTKEELAQLKKDEAFREKQIAEMEAAAVAKAALLERLGITEEEAQLLLR
jgi:nucleoside phosphorylase